MSQTIANDLNAVEWNASFEFPFHARAPVNLRGNWRAHYLRSVEEKRALYYAWIAAMRPRPPVLPVRIRFVRIAPRDLDSDNLESAFKAMRDQLTECLGLKNDGKNGGAIWDRCGQERRGVREYAVRVEMRAEGSIRHARSQH